jgi:hypothetical protein
VRGEWQRIEDPLGKKPLFPLPHGSATPEELSEWREKRRKRFEDAGYAPYAWLSFDPSERWPMFTVHVYVAVSEVPHEFLVVLGKEGTDFDIYVPDLPNLIRLLQELAPIAAWDIATEVERARQEASKPGEEE